MWHWFINRQAKQSAVPENMKLAEIIYGKIDPVRWEQNCKRERECFSELQLLECWKSQKQAKALARLYSFINCSLIVYQRNNLLSCFFWAKWTSALSRAQHQHDFFLSLGVLWSAHQVFSNGDERAGKWALGFYQPARWLFLAWRCLLFFLAAAARIIIIVFQQKQWDDAERECHILQQD
jgi:hypothetical protein